MITNHKKGNTMKHAYYRRGPSPFAIIVFGILLFWLFGFKLFFFLPLLFIFGACGMWGSCGVHHYEHEWADEKPKRKPTPDYNIDDNPDDVTYV